MTDYTNTQGTIDVLANGQEASTADKRSYHEQKQVEEGGRAAGQGATPPSVADLVADRRREDEAREAEEVALRHAAELEAAIHRLLPEAHGAAPDWSDLGHAWRLLHAASPDLLLAGRRDLQPQVYLAQPGGVWAHDRPGLLDHLVRVAQPLLDMLDSEIARNSGKGGDKARLAWARAGRTALRSVAGDNGLDRALTACGSATLAWQAAHGQFPPGLTQCHSEDLDQSATLGTPQGVFCLRRMVLLDDAAARRALVTHSLPDAIDLDARHPDVDALTSHLPPDLDCYLWQVLGHTLRGRPSRRIYLLLGPPGGGKSTLLEALRTALGDVTQGGYSGSVAADVLKADRSSGRRGVIAPELAGLMPPSRLATMADGLERIDLDNNRLKALSGGDSLAWRRPYERNVQYTRATATMLLAGNELPKLDLTDPATRERIKILPWPALAAPDPSLLARLTSEAGPAVRQAIVARLLRGMRECPAGLPPEPQAVIDAVREAGDETLGEVGCTIRDALKQVAGARLDGKEVWTFATERHPPDGKGRCGGHTQRSLSRLVTRLTGTKQVLVSIDGRKGRAWRGWTLDADAEGSLAEIAIPDVDGIYLGDVPPGEDLTP